MRAVGHTALRPLRWGWRRPRIALPFLAGVVISLGAFYEFWLRDSSLFAVRQVTVTGVSGRAAPGIRTALTGAAEGMTTLHVRMGDLRAAVRAYPAIKELRVHPQLLHHLSIEVVERPPVAALAGDRHLAAAADGAVMTGVPVQGLPVLDVPAPSGQHLDGRRTLAALALLGVAPAPLRAAVSRVTLEPADGVVAHLRRGPKLVLGDASRARAKWAAVAAVLVDRKAAGATYLDVRVPDRPVAGRFPPGDPRAAGIAAVAAPAPPSPSTGGVAVP